MGMVGRTPRGLSDTALIVYGISLAPHHPLAYQGGGQDETVGGDERLIVQQPAVENEAHGCGHLAEEEPF